MGSLVSKEQVEEVSRRVKELAEESELVFGNLDRTFDVLGVIHNRITFFTN